MKIYAKLLLFLLLLSLIPLVGVTIFTYNKFADEIVSNAFEQLKATATEKMGALDHFFEELEDSAMTAAGSINTQQIILGKAGQSSLFFQSVSSRYDLENIVITDPKGSVLYSESHLVKMGTSFASQVHQGAAFEELLQKVIRSAEASYSGFDFITSEKNPSILLGVPVLNDRNVVGALFYEISPMKIYRIFSDYALLGQTGEMLVGKRVGDSAQFINPIRHNQKAAFRLKILIGSDIAYPIQEAVQGIDGQGESIDYRDKKILAVWRYIPRKEWGVVVKIDFDEIYAPVVRFRNLLIITVLLTFFVVVLVAIYLARSISRPIKSLQDNVVVATQGNWSDRIQVSTRDEMGELAQSFNQMLDALQKSTTSIEELNSEIARREHLEEEKLQLLSRVSHELRTPIAPIQEGVSLMLEGVAGEINDKQRELLELATKNVERLHYLVNEILDFQKIDHGKIEYDFQTNNVNALIEESVNSFQPVAQKKELQIVHELAADLPEVKLDKMRILQVLSNLVGNAIKFTSQSPITIFSRAKDGGIEVEIRQLGVSISKEDHAQLFVPFQQITKHSKQKIEGTGLGLVIAQKIIEAHGGKIWAHSESDAQTSFYFYLPAKPPTGE